MRWWSWLLNLAALVVGVVLMGLRPDHSLAAVLAFVGLGVIVGGWLLATRGGVRLSSTSSRHNDQMLRDIEQRLQHFETPELHTQAAAIYLERGKLKPAMTHLERAIALRPGNDNGNGGREAMRARYLLGQVYLQRNEPAKAWPLFDAVYRADANYQFGEIKLWAARTYLALHEPEIAHKLTDDFLQRERGHFQALTLKAEALWQMDRLDEAKEVYRELLEGLQHAPGFSREALRDVERLARRRLET